jgi:fibronectin type 3 domain-containing protein
MKAWKRILLLGIIFCIVLATGSFALESQVSDAEDIEEIVIDAEEATSEQEAEEPEEDANQTVTQEITIQDITGNTSKPIATQSTKVSANKTLRILAIGNSFTRDTMRYVAQIAHSAGYNVTVGVLQKSSLSLKKHWDYIDNDLPQYTYSKFSKDSNYEMVSQDNVAPSEAFADEEWNLVFLQQTSYLNGDPSSILDDNGVSYITQITNRVRESVSNPDVSFAWLMGWAYANDYQGAAFARYNNDQLTMYDAIANTTQNTVWASGDLDIIIPVGTAIQNARSSYVGDNLNRDGKHLSFGMGRYLAGLTVASSIGINISKVTYFPTGSQTVSRLHKAMLVQAAKSAVKYPFTQTQSTHTAQPAQTTPNIKKITNSSSGVTIQWKSCTGASYYSVYRKTGDNDWKTVASSTTKLSCTDTKAVNGTKYSYKVLAHYDSNLNSTISNAAASYRISPVTISKTEKTTDSVTLNWKANSKATSYQLRYSTSKKMTGAKTLSLKTITKQTITGLNSNKTYYFQIRAKEKVGSKTYSGAWGDVVTVKTLSNAPATPTEVTAAAGKKSATLTWKASSRATSYQIQYSMSKKMTGAKTISLKTVTKQTITGLKSGKTYYFRIRAIRTANSKSYYSAWSSVVSAKTS